MWSHKNDVSTIWLKDNMRILAKKKTIQLPNFYYLVCFVHLSNKYGIYRFFVKIVYDRLRHKDEKTL